MRILFICGREEGYTRNQVLFRAFERIASVKKTTDTNPKKSIPRRSLEILLRAFPQVISGSYDLLFVGFYGHLLMLPLGVFRHRPILFDAFISTYDTLIMDRRKASAHSPLAWAAYALDWLACRLARIVLVDTPLQAAYFAETFHQPLEKFVSIPVGCNEEIFFPRPRKEDRAYLTVLYYCTYLPLHGADIVVQAARQLHDLPIRFRLIGTGPEFQTVRDLAQKFDLKNVEFLPSVSLQCLADEIIEADICLGGHFGGSEKAGRVIPGKVYQILACGKAMIAAETPANVQFLTHLKNAYLCPPSDPLALALAIRELQANPILREKIGQEGVVLFATACSERAITQTLNDVISTYFQ